ncbi:MAG: hypothetical protein HFJ42_00535 [Clostridia bacterium]|nr:hypothetical protein [Clostridia bacterium]
MKKLETLLQKLTKIIGVNGMWSSDVAQVVTCLVLMLLFGGIEIWIAVVFQKYLILSMITFLWVWMIQECFINKIFFKKLDNYLLQTPKATTLVFGVIFIITMILSWNYFTGFMLTTILAFIIGDFRKNKENKKKQ